MLSRVLGGRTGHLGRRVSPTGLCAVGRTSPEHCFKTGAVRGRELERTVVGWVSLLRTSAGPRALEELESAVAGAWALGGQVPQVIRHQVQIALSEIVANIVEHGGTGPSAVNIEIQMSIGPGQVQARVCDDGVEVHVDLAGLSMPACLAERGRGLAMAQRALDTLSYQRRAGLNHWILASKSF